MVEKNWNLEEDSPPGVSLDDLVAIVHHEGRDMLGVFPPLTLGHYCQTLAGEFAKFAKDMMTTKGIDEGTAKSISTRLATLGLRQFVNIAEFGYGERILEERAGLEPLSSSPQPIDT